MLVSAWKARWRACSLTLQETHPAQFQLQLILLLTMEMCACLAKRWHTHTRTPRRTHTHTLTHSPKQTLAHLLIQHSRIPVPKITRDGGQIIVALIYEKLSIKHIWSDYHAVIFTRLLNTPCMCFLSPSLPFSKQWLHGSSSRFISSDIRISHWKTV